MQPVDQFRHHLDQHAELVGFSAPPLLIDYLAQLCADRLKNPNIIPDPSFAERWLLLNQDPRPDAMVNYADTALFFVSLLPEYGHRRGLNITYYAALGQGAYHAAAVLTDDSRYDQLSQWFMYLQQFLSSAIKPHQRMELFDLPGTR